MFKKEKQPIEFLKEPSDYSDSLPQDCKLLKINFNTMNLQLSGGSRVILELACRLSKRGHEVTINAIGKKDDAKWFGNHEDVKINFAFPSKITRLIFQKLLGQSFLDVQGRLLDKMVAKADCEINIATFCLTALPTFESKKGCGFYLVQNYEPLFFDDPVFIARAEKSYELPLTKLCVSKWLQQKIGGIHIGNGVNIKIFNPKNSFEEKEPNSVVYLYRNIPWKGDLLAMETLTKLYSLNQKISIHLVVRKNSKLNADFPYILHEDLSDEELAKLYSKVCVLLFTSNFEGYGLPPLEAFACGTNVVSTDFIGNGFLVNDKNCFLAKEPADLANAILNLITNKAVAKCQLVKAQLTVKEHDFDLMVEKMLKAFNSCRSKQNVID